MVIQSLKNYSSVVSVVKLLLEIKHPAKDEPGEGVLDI